jgi:hypothetical protein
MNAAFHEEETKVCEVSAIVKVREIRVLVRNSHELRILKEARRYGELSIGRDTTHFPVRGKADECRRKKAYR